MGLLSLEKWPPALDSCFVLQFLNEPQCLPWPQLTWPEPKHSLCTMNWGCFHIPRATICLIPNIKHGWSSALGLAVSLWTLNLGSEPNSNVCFSVCVWWRGQVLSLKAANNSPHTSWLPYNSAQCWPYPPRDSIRFYKVKAQSHKTVPSPNFRWSPVLLSNQL